MANNKTVREDGLFWKMTCDGKKSSVVVVVDVCKWETAEGKRSKVEAAAETVVERRRPGGVRSRRLLTQRLTGEGGEETGPLEANSGRTGIGVTAAKWV